MSDDFETDDAYYQTLGLQCGLEIHQQLLTEKKLFCRCDAVLRRDKPSATLLRHMRPTLSELGEYDGTALMEFKTKKDVIYQLYNETVCTYEMDDTPPFHLNYQALDIALEIALLLNYSIVDEIHISRKQYLDGSIPTGFQRTGIVGVEGWFPYKKRKIRLIQLGLEEDACREISDVGHQIVFKTDRLSIPLVEVVTHPDILTPREAMEVARYIGRVLRSTGKVRRGLGSVRQDVNVSITGGTRVELKGISKLQYIAKAVACEASRQKALLDIRDELRGRGVTETTFQSEVRDVSSVFKHSKCKRLRDVLKQKERIFGIVLRVFAGIANHPTQPGKTFGDELAGRVKVIACLDVMPNLVARSHFCEFGLSRKEVAQLTELFDVKSTDELVLFWGNEVDAKTAVDEIRIRAVEATKGVPSETRQVFADGTNVFERILPGPNRMYPDTDTPPTPISEKYLTEIQTRTTEKLWEYEKRLADFGLPASLVASLSISKNRQIFDRIVGEFAVSALLVAVTLEETLKHLRREGKNVDSISEDTLYDLFQRYSTQQFSKEAIPSLLAFVADNPGTTVEQALAQLKIHPMSLEEVQDVVSQVVQRFSAQKKTRRLQRIVMGEVMKVARNRIDGCVVSKEVETTLGMKREP